MRQSTKTTLTTRGFHAFLPCRAAVVIQDPQLRGRDHPPPPGPIGSVWRKLNPGQQALLVLPTCAKARRSPSWPPGSGSATATAWRYVNETVALLAARAPKLRKAVRDAKKAGYAYVVLDGTLIAIDRVAADRPFYSGKHRRHGMNLQVIASPPGTSCGCPGRCPARSTTRRPSGSGASCASSRPPAWSRWPIRATRGPGEDPVPGKGQAGIAERGQPRPREAPRARRKGKRPAQELDGSSASSAAAPGAPGRLAKAIHALEIHAA